MATFCLMFLIRFFAIAPQIAPQAIKKVSENAETPDKQWCAWHDSNVRHTA